MNVSLVLGEVCDCDLDVVETMEIESQNKEVTMSFVERFLLSFRGSLFSF